MPKSSRKLRNLALLQKAALKDGSSEPPIVGAPPPAAASQGFVNLTEGITRASLTADAFAPPPVARDVATDHERSAMRRELEVLERIRREKSAALGRESFDHFVKEIAYPGDIWQEHYGSKFHQEIIDAVQQLARGKNLWVFVPREHRKSFLLTILRSLWLIVKDPNIRILIVGANKGIVKGLMVVLRSAFIEGMPGWEKFQATYPELVWKAGEAHKTLKSVFEFTVRTRTVQRPDPTVRAAYLGISASWRCDTLVLDDCVDRRNSTNPDMSRQTLGHILGLLPMIDSKSPLRNIVGMGTRFAYHDAYGYIIGEDTGESTDADQKAALRRFEVGQTRIMIRHASEDPTKPCEHCPKHVVAAYPHGHPSMDENARISASPVWTRELLMERYYEYLTDPDKGESFFFHQYQNICISPKSRKFQPAWFIDMHIPRWPAAKRRILVIDSAFKDFQKEGTGDYMVALFGEFDDEGRLIIVHGLRSNTWTRDDLTRHIISWCKAVNWWPHVVAKQKFGEDSYLKDVRREMLAQNRPVHVKPIKRPPDVQKNDFIVETLQGPMERQEVLFGSMFPPDLRKRAEYETCNLGQVRNDDIPDTIALFFVPGVRVELPSKQSGRVDTQYVPPDLGLYNPGAPRQFAPIGFEGPRNSLEKVMAQDSVRRFLFDLSGDSPIAFDNAPGQNNTVQSFGLSEWE